MPRASKHVDRIFLIVTILLVVIGFFIFTSASLGLLARDGARFSSVAVSQLVFGIGAGMVSLLIFSNISYRSYRHLSPYFFGIAVLLTSLVFVPGIGHEVNGASRWLYIGNFSIQPAEILKLTSVLFLAWFYSFYYRKMNDIKYSLGALFGMLFIVGVILMLQPDTGTFLIISTASIAIAFSSGIKFKHIALMGVAMLIGIAVIAVSRPYIFDRVTTFLNPSSDPDGSGYQIRQSLIAVGSGGLIGRGFGQSVQKFNYLPEPIGDSIFSVASEEFGFVGSVFIVLLFVFFVLRGLYIAAHTPDRFGGLIVIGIVILILTQSFMNIGSMIGIMPLTGEPLTFISHGGTSLFFTLTGVGMVLNISRYKKTKI